MRSSFVKQGPIVFLKEVLMMELLAIALLFLASFIENYEMLYRGLSLDDYLRYDLFILIMASLFQLGYLIILFLSWYFSYFEIKDSEVIRKSGILFHRKKSIRLADIITVETHQSPLDRLIKHGTITLEHKDGKFFKMQNISNYEECVETIKRAVQNSSRSSRPKNLEALLDQDESKELEFKETLRHDTHTNQVNKELEKVILKTIVGFLNTDGGTLLIGVSDVKKVVGLERDYQNLPKKNKDGFENHLTMLLKANIGISFVKYIDISFIETKNESGKKVEVCLISVKSSHRPAYLTNGDKKEEFFIRTHNSTQPLSMSDTQEYIQTHFKS